MADCFAEYRRRYPEVTLELSLDSRKIDLIADGFDMALRVSSDPQPSLIVKPLTEIRFFPVASPDYLRRHGVPATLAEAAQHQAVLPSYVDMGTVTFTRNGETEALQLTSPMRSNSTLMLRKLIQAGSGIGYMPEWLVAPAIASGQLVQL
ncbi:MAG TPA: substrate binding domain-containing protein, partial [Neisseria sp.]|nr:substrate binding domain-containing protein [Neisseria sp.]